MKHLPGRKKDRFWEKKWIVELLNVLPPFGTAVAAAVMAAADPTRRQFFGLLSAICVALGIGSIIKVLHARERDKERKRIEDYDGLNGALHVLYAVVRSIGGLPDGSDDKLRVTIHRIVRDGRNRKAPREMEQMLPYVCRSSGGEGRKFPIQSGIIGKAARECAVYSASRQSADYDSSITELVREWGFTEEDARALRQDRVSWMAVPIVYPGEASAVAVVYLDSDQQDFFTPEVKDVVSMACAGISSYLPEAY